MRRKWFIKLFLVLVFLYFFNPVYIQYYKKFKLYLKPERISNDTKVLNFVVFDVETPVNRNLYFVQPDEIKLQRTCRIPYIFPYEKEAIRYINQEIIDHDIQIPHCILNHTEKFETDQDSMLMRKSPEEKFWQENTCCYTPFTTNNWTLLNLTNCINFTQSITKIPTNYENIQVQCQNIKNELTYVDYFHFFRLNETREKELDEILKLDASADETQLNIIFLGLDTISFANFQRLLPKTRKYLIEELDAIEFSGVNKVGIGTMENLTPMITGCDWTNKKKGRMIPQIGKFECDLIWEEYEKKGYRTILSQEEPWVIIFQKLRQNDQGTHNTTYDNFPFAQGIQSTCPFALKTYGCFEHKLAINVLGDRILQVARKLKSKPYFHFLWEVFESHDLIAMSKLLDDPLYNLFKNLLFEKFLDNTVLLVLSDHGMVFSPYSNTKNGHIEANTPFLYMVLPTWFKEKYSRGISNLKRNSKGLITPRDIYKTLISFFHLSSITNEILESTSSSTNENQSESFINQNNPSFSLFYPIPINRTCLDARIPKQYCICWTWREIVKFKSDKKLHSAAVYSVKYINKELENYPQCAQLKFIRLRSGKQTTDNFGTTYFLISLETSPNDAKFNVMFTVNGSNSSVPFEIVGQIERINAYGTQSACLGHPLTTTGWIRSVCYCVNNKIVEKDKRFKDNEQISTNRL